MMDKDNLRLAIVLLGVILYFGSLNLYEYKIKELEAKQPKYLIEIKDEKYELKKIN